MDHPVASAFAGTGTRKAKLANAAADGKATHRIAGNEIDQFHTLGIAHDRPGAALEFGHLDNGYNGHNIE